MSDLYEVTFSVYDALQYAALFQEVLQTTIFVNLTHRTRINEKKLSSAFKTGKS